MENLLSSIMVIIGIGVGIVVILYGLFLIKLILPLILNTGIAIGGLYLIFKVGGILGAIGLVLVVFGAVAVWGYVTDIIEDGELATLNPFNWFNQDEDE